MTPVGGGVTLEPQEALQASNVQPDKDGKVSQAYEGIRLDQLAPGQWWWD
jgi:hypothetical protein